MTAGETAPSSFSWASAGRMTSGQALSWCRATALRRTRVFDPGVHVIAETGRVFIGAGTRLLCYRWTVDGAWRRQWEEHTFPGFWGWRQHGDVVVMSAELEISAWTTEGDRLWSTPVEPPWSYTVDGDVMHLEVMGQVRDLAVGTG